MPANCNFLSQNAWGLCADAIAACTNWLTELNSLFAPSLKRYSSHVYFSVTTYFTEDVVNKANVIKKVT